MKRIKFQPYFKHQYWIEIGFGFSYVKNSMNHFIDFEFSFFRWFFGIMIYIDINNN